MIYKSLSEAVSEQDIAEEDIGNLASLTIAVKHLEKRMDIFGDTIKTCNIDHSPAAVAERLDRAWDMIESQDNQIGKLLVIMQDNYKIVQSLTNRVEKLELNARRGSNKVKIIQPDEGAASYE